jgi:outer membrane protein OmpA-like peptidoglycan-associated protein
VKDSRFVALVAPSLAAIALFVAACGTPTPSAELKSARNAYEDTKRSKSATLVPDKVLEAEQALKKAEAAHNEDPQSELEKHFSYLAERRALIARVQGDIAQAEKDKTAAEEQYLTTLDARRRKAEGSLEKTGAELSKERAARQEMERKLNAALRSLEEIAKVKEESRGMVITLSGAVLFASDKSELLPIAKEKLDQVAVALQSTDPSQKIVVEGHTDSVGVDAYNQKLSEDRANAVRTHLVSKGETVPIADNTSPEGRANNRRVEIIVSPKGR